MSAIFGIVSLSGRPIAEKEMATLGRLLTNRAPQHCDIWHHPSSLLSLGCRLLRTTPESIDETQPWIDPISGMAVVADARLDNRHELLSALAMADTFAPDSQIILRAYLCWGEDCVSKMLGDFVFCIWNPLANELFFARDHTGGRSLSYTRSGDFFAFSSSPESLLALDWVDRGLNEDAMANLLVYNYPLQHETATWYSGVHGLLTGQALTLNLSNGATKITTYWQPTEAEPDKYRSEQEAQEAFRAVFKRAVADRLRCNTPPALMVSGGMDSASIVAMTDILWHEGQSPPLHTYSVLGDDTSNCIESQCILSLTGRDCFEPHYLRVPSVGGLMNGEQLFHTAWDNPHPVDSDILIQSSLMQSASQRGHNIILHGTSGDLTLWSSTQYIASLFQQGRLLRGIKECFAANDHHTYYFGLGTGHILARNLYHAFAPAWLRNVYHHRRKRPGNSAELSFVNPEFAQRLQIQERLRENTAISFELSLQQNYWRDYLRSVQGIASGLGGANRLGTRYGLETRDPFGDKRVVDFFIRLPQDWKVRSGWTKYLPRTSFPAQQPDPVRFRRGKESLGRDVHLAALNFNRDFIEHCIQDHFHLLNKYVDQQYIEQMIQGYHRGNAPAARVLYDLVTWALWLNNLQSGKIAP